MESGTAIATDTAPGRVDPWEAAAALDDRVVVDGIEALERVISQLEATRAALVSEVDRRGLPAREGFGSTTGWLISHTGEQPGICRSRVRSARALRHMPHTRTAFSTGNLPESRARMLVEARDTAPVVFERDESLLVSQAQSLPAPGFRRAVAYWRRLADHDGYLRDSGRARRQRHLHASVTWEGTVRVDGLLDPESGATVIAALGSLTDPTNLDPDDHRTPAQRRADALTELARRYLDRSDRPTVGGERPHVTVHLDLDALEGRAGRRCETTQTGAITPQAARRLACDARVTRIITGPGGQPLDIGRATRTIPAPIRRALTARDRHCTHPGCTTPAAWCDAHHIRHWADGGPTSLPNLRLLCRRHHRIAHRDTPHRVTTHQRE